MIKGLLGLVLIYIIVAILSSCSFASTPTPLPLIPSDAFVAISDQGRPLVGASVNVADLFGNQVPACMNTSCTTVITTIPPSGIFQFYAAAGTYNVTIAGAGISRNYQALLPAGASGGGGITSLNGLTSAALIIDSDATGTGPSFTTPDSTHIRLHLPLAGSGITAGLVSNGLQTFFGAKLFEDPVTFNGAVNLNGVTQSINGFEASTSTIGCAFNVDWANNQVDFGTCDGSGNTSFVNIINTSNSKTGLLITSTMGSEALNSSVTGGSGSAVIGTTFSGNSGTAVQGISVSTSSRAGYFSRIFVGDSSVPVGEVSRSSNSDTQPLLKLTDTTTTTAATYVQEYTLNNVLKWGITPTGSFLGAKNNAAPQFSFIGDITTGLRWQSAGVVTVDAAGTPGILVSSTVVETNLPTIVGVASGATDAFAVANLGTGKTINTDSGKFTVDKLGQISAAKQFISAFGSGGPDFTFSGDLTTGLRQQSAGVVTIDAAGTPGILVASTVVENNLPTIVGVSSGSSDAFTVANLGTGLSINTDSGNFAVTKAGEITWAGVGNDGTGKTICVKSDKNIGTCTDQPDGSGVCTCA